MPRSYYSLHHVWLIAWYTSDHELLSRCLFPAFLYKFSLFSSVRKILFQSWSRSYLPTYFFISVCMYLFIYFFLPNSILAILFFWVTSGLHLLIVCIYILEGITYRFWQWYSCFLESYLAGYYKYYKIACEFSILANVPNWFDNS